MLSTRLFTGICRQTCNNNAAPIISLLNKNQFYSANFGSNITNSLEVNKKNISSSKNISVTTIKNFQSLNWFANEFPSTSIVRYKSNLPTELPSGDQLQKYFFRVLGFVLDVSKTIICWTIKIIQNIINHRKTKEYWGRLQNKIEDARKK